MPPPIDHTIPLQVKQFQAPDLLGDMVDAAQLKSTMSYDQVQQYKLADLMQERRDRDLVRNIAGGSDLTTDAGRQHFVDTVSKAAPHLGFEYGDKLAAQNKDRAATRKSEWELGKERNDWSAAQTGAFLNIYQENRKQGIPDAQTAQDLVPRWRGVLNRMRGMAHSDGTPMFTNEELRGIPATPDLDFIQTSFMGAIKANDQLDAMMEQQRLGETQRHNQASEANTVRGQNITLRGQDLSAQTARRGQDLTAGGQQFRLVTPEEAEQAGLPPGSYQVNSRGEIKEIAAGSKSNPMAKEAAARDVLTILNEAEGLIGGATGSYGGAAYDQGAAVFGASTPGAQNIAKLKVIEGAILSKMPRMEGPQSNYDVQLYKQAAAQLGDATTPRETKQAALDQLRALQEKYAGMEAGSSRPQGNGASGSWSIRRLD